jgi:lipoic acid synthetase
VRDGVLHTVCEEALCPNIAECWEEHEATFLVLGDRCTRRCGFCDVATAKPSSPDPTEPARLASAAHALGLEHVVLTGVARDDLPLGGAAAWAASVLAIREALPRSTIEVLVPDFSGDMTGLALVLDAYPDVFAHNLETVRRLHPHIRPAFDYERSLTVLRSARRLRVGQLVKSNMILGMGETPGEVSDALRDLAEAGCNIVTLGQYLQPTRRHLPVDRWVTPDEFDEHEALGRSLGIAHVEAGPLVRSSYHARRQHRSALAAMQSCS